MTPFTPGSATVKLYEGIFVLTCISSLVLYLFLASRSILLPGIQYDEAVQAPHAITMLKGEQSESLRPMLTLTAAGISFPVMQVEYAGSLKSYLLALTFGLFGPSVETLRITVILVGLLGLIFFALLAKDVFDKRTAMLGILLVSTDPSFILYCRQDWGPVAIAFALRMISLFCLYRWMRDGKAYNLICAFTCFGLGVYDKVNFLWFVVGIAVTAGLIAILTKKRPHTTTAHGIAAAIALLVTSAPVWVLNICCHWPTLRAVSMYGMSGQSVSERIAILKATLQGTATNAWMFGEAVNPSYSFNATLLWPLFAVAFPFVAIYGTLRPEGRLRFLALFVLISAMSLQILMSPLLIGPHHWLSLYPLPHVAIAVLILEAPHIPLRWIQKCGSANIAIAIVLIVVLFNLSTVAHHYRLATSTGGHQSWSDGIYRLADLLKKDFPDRSIQLMDWGFANQLSLLSSGKFHLYEPFWYDHNDSQYQQTLVRRFCELLKNRDNVFVIHSFRATKLRYSASAFEAAIMQAGVSPRQEQVIFDLRGTELCRLLVF
jgi:hypothetical protein